MHATSVAAVNRIAGSTTNEVGTSADAHPNERTGVRPRDPKTNFPFLDSSPSLSSSLYLLGMTWRQHYFVDLALPFGLRSAPYIFNSLADLFQWSLIHNYLVPELLHYLDDYLTRGPPASPVCDLSLRAIQQAAVDIGIPLAPDKIESPTTRLIFFGN